MLALTNAQKTTMKNAIVADPTANAFPNTADGNFNLANYCNVTGAFQGQTAVNVWNPYTLVDPTINAAITWKDFEALTLQLQTTYLAITQSGTVNMADQATARGLVGMLSQTDGIFVDASNSSINIRAASQRAGTRMECLLSSLGGGTLGNAPSAANVVQKDKNGLSLYGQLMDYQTLLDLR